MRKLTNKVSMFCPSQYWLRSLTSVLEGLNGVNCQPSNVRGNHPPTLPPPRPSFTQKITWSNRQLFYNFYPTTFFQLGVNNKYMLQTLLTSPIRQKRVSDSQPWWEIKMLVSLTTQAASSVLFNLLSGIDQLKCKICDAVNRHFHFIFTTSTILL